LKQSLNKPAGLETPVNVDSSCAQINVALTPYSLSKHLSIPVNINKAERSRNTLLDSGAMGNFISESLVEQLAIPRQPREQIPLHDVQGIKIGEIAHQVTITMRIGIHEEQLTLDVANIGNHILILGLPWLKEHNPEIDWLQGRAQFNSDYCNNHCFPKPNDIFLNAMTMNPSTFPVVRFSPSSKLPTRGSEKSAGLDLYSIDEVTIPPWSRTLVDMGIGAGVPTGTYGRIAPRSGLAAKSSIDIGAGVIDADYTSAIKVLMINNSEMSFQVTVRMQIAQLILEKVETLEPRDSSTLETTGRNNKGFGSTGISIITPEIVQQIPAEYHEFLDVFDPDLPSMQLPPHQPQYDFALKLDPNKPLPKPA